MLRNSAAGIPGAAACGQTQGHRPAALQLALICAAFLDSWPLVIPSRSTWTEARAVMLSPGTPGRAGVGWWRKQFYLFGNFPLGGMSRQKLAGGPGHSVCDSASSCRCVHLHPKLHKRYAPSVGWSRSSASGSDNARTLPWTLQKSNEGHEPDNKTWPCQVKLPVTHTTEQILQRVS